MFPNRVALRGGRDLVLGVSQALDVLVGHVGGRADAVDRYDDRVAGGMAKAVRQLHGNPSTSQQANESHEGLDPLVGGREVVKRLLVHRTADQRAIAPDEADRRVAEVAEDRAVAVRGGVQGVDDVLDFRHCSSTVLDLERAGATGGELKLPAAQTSQQSLVVGPLQGVHTAHAVEITGVHRDEVREGHSARLHPSLDGLKRLLVVSRELVALVAADRQVRGLRGHSTTEGRRATRHSSAEQERRGKHVTVERELVTDDRELVKVLANHGEEALVEPVQVGHDLHEDAVGQAGQGSQLIDDVLAVLGGLVQGILVGRGVDRVRGTVPGGDACHGDCLLRLDRVMAKRLVGLQNRVL